ncbi:hypothetical protein IC575_019917 [Cucumis melo]
MTSMPPLTLSLNHSFMIPCLKYLDTELDRLKAWITDKHTDNEICDVIDGKKSKMFFGDLFMCYRWLVDEHLDALFLFIRLKIIGIPYAQNFTTKDTIFMVCTCNTTLCMILNLKVVFLSFGLT